MATSPRPWKLEVHPYYKSRTLKDANGNILMQCSPQDGRIGDIIDLTDEDWSLIEWAGTPARGFSARNRKRCQSPLGFNHPIGSWSTSDWMTATLGELGEAANIVKKLNRVRDGIPGNDETPAQLRAMLADEIADTAIYLDLLAQSVGMDLEVIRNAKFAKTSAKIGYAESDY